MTLIETVIELAPGAEQAAEHGAEHGEAAAFPPFDPTYFASQLFWLAIFFVLFYLLMSRWILPRIGSIIEERRDRVADDLDTAQQLKAQADETRDTYEKSLADARAKAHALAVETKAKVSAEIAEETAALEAEIAERTAESEKALEKARKKALGEVRGIAASTAAQIAESLSGLSVTEADAEAALPETTAR